MIVLDKKSNTAIIAVLLLLFILVSKARQSLLVAPVLYYLY